VKEGEWAIRVGGEGEGEGEGRRGEKREGAAAATTRQVVFIGMKYKAGAVVESHPTVQKKVERHLQVASGCAGC